MNRLIKFRLYCPHNKEMYYDDDENFELRIQNGEFSYIPIDDDSYCFYSNIADDLENECLNIIPMQFTGLYDKNGKEIYEGDIIRSFSMLSDESTTVFQGVVIYKDDSFIIDGESIHIIFSAHCNLMLNLKNKEVIGNIHENPELLNNGKD